MDTMASQFTSPTIVNSTVYSGADQRKHQSSASLAFVRRIHRWPVNSSHKWPVTRKMFPFDDVIILLALFYGNPPTVISSQMASNAWSVSMWWRTMHMRRQGKEVHPDSKFHGANMGPHVDPMNLVIWVHLWCCPRDRLLNQQSRIVLAAPRWQCWVCYKFRF